MEVTITTAIHQANATTTIRPIATATMVLASHSNIISDYVFQGIHTAKVLVLKRFIPS